jgi:hypothetical protein
MTSVVRGRPEELAEGRTRAIDPERKLAAQLTGTGFPSIELNGCPYSNGLDCDYDVT